MRSNLWISSLCTAITLTSISRVSAAPLPIDDPTPQPAMVAPLEAPNKNDKVLNGPPSISIEDAQRRSALQKLLSDGAAMHAARKEEQLAIETFYKQRDFQPAWTDSGTPTPRALIAAAHLKAAAREGLDPADYPTPDLPAFLNADDAAKADIKLSQSLLTFVRHSNSGRVSYTRVSGSILYPTRNLDGASVLSQLALADDIAASLTAFEPPQPAYKALKAQLAKELAQPSPAGQTEKSGKFKKVDLISANMERWRWMPRDLGTAYVVVNIPQYTLQLMNDGKPVWATKIVVGKPGDMSTPLLSETMKYLTINPTWNVPSSIIRNEYLPALQRDSGALERAGLKLARNHDGSVRIYQPPGPKNALGRIRFNFPNPFLVYQHDTPSKALFAQDKRALSHGCMRVQNPEKYAEALLSVSQLAEGVTAARIRDLYGDEERTINLKRPIPVHITYQTASVDDAGALVTREDIYGLDAAILKLMHGPDRIVADRAIPRDYQQSSKPVMSKLPNATADRDESRREDGRRRAALQPMPTAFFDRAVGAW